MPSILIVGIVRNKVLPILLARVAGRSTNDLEILGVLVRRDIKFAVVEIGVVFVALATRRDDLPFAQRIVSREIAIFAASSLPTNR